MAQCPQLHEKGVLVVGSVLEASLSPSSEYDSSAAAASFKVLFIEGDASRPLVFRSKTSVYSSPAVPSEENHPTWPDNSFRFDLILSEQGQLAGDIMISFYRSRPNGGNDLVGQATFNLPHLAQTGTVEVFHRDLEGRSVAGKHTLYSTDQSAMVGYVILQLNIAWRGGGDVYVAPPPVVNTAPIRVGGGSIAGHSTTSRPRSASATATRRAGGSVSNLNARGASPPRKIVSKFMLKQEKEARRINMENKKLQQALAKNAVKSNTNAGLVYASDAKETLRRPVSEDKSRLGRSKQMSEEKDDVLFDKLKGAHDQLKSSNAELEAEIVSLRAKLSNLNIQMQKIQNGIERGRALGGGKEVQPTTAARTSTPQNTTDDIVDLEYQQIKEEYDILQNIRRGFLERISHAKQAQINATKLQSSIEQDQQSMRTRVFHFYNEFRPFFLVSPQAADGREEEKESLLLYDQLVSLRSELRQLQILRQYDCLDDMSVVSSRRELEAVLSFLQLKVRTLRSEVEKLRSEEDRLGSESQVQTTAKALLHKREFLKKLKTLEFSLASEERHRIISQAIKRNELGLVKLRSLARERKIILDPHAEELL
eukprot:gene6976-7719_t